MSWQVPLSDLDYSDREINAVVNVLRSRWLTMGEISKRFEEEFCKYTGAGFAAAVSNATTGLHLACTAAGLGPDDEVIVPSLSFVATSNAVLYTGATVKFADICGEDDLTIDPAAVRAQITPRTKAIIVMHYGGNSCRMDEILQIARENHLFVIEDAAHAAGCYYNDRHMGTLGDIGVFSFFSNKNLATGEGGMITTNRADLYEKIKAQRSHGMTTLTYDRHQGHAFSYDVTDLGYNYRIDEIHSALGLEQLAKLTENNEKRGRVAQEYRERMAGLPIHIPSFGNRSVSAYHIFPVLLPRGANRERWMLSLKEQGIQTSIHYPPIHQFSYYRNRFGQISLPQTEDVAAREMTLPMFPTMTQQQIDLVCQALEKTSRTENQL